MKIVATYVCASSQGQRTHSVRTNYEEALDELGIETLEERRKTLSLGFADKCLKNEKAEKMLPLNEKKHNMDTRKTEKQAGAELCQAQI
jgi:hypothetical protein